MRDVLGDDERFVLVEHRQRRRLLPELRAGARRRSRRRAATSRWPTRTTCWHPDKLARQVAVLRGRPGRPARGQRRPGDRPRRARELAPTFYAHRAPTHDDPYSLFIVNSLIGASMVFRRSCSTSPCRSRGRSRTASTITGWPGPRSSPATVGFVAEPLHDYVQHGANVFGDRRATAVAARPGASSRSLRRCAGGGSLPAGVARRLRRLPPRVLGRRRSCCVRRCPRGGDASHGWRGSSSLDDGQLPRAVADLHRPRARATQRAAAPRERRDRPVRRPLVGDGPPTAGDRCTHDRQPHRTATRPRRRCWPSTCRSSTRCRRTTSGGVRASPSGATSCAATASTRTTTSRTSPASSASTTCACPRSARRRRRWPRRTASPGSATTTTGSADGASSRCRSTRCCARARPDFPFCLCWANEPWTRNWDGGTRELLIAQRYSAEDDRNHIRWLINAFRDERYIRVGDRPVFFVYNVGALPQPRADGRDLARGVRQGRRRRSVPRAVRDVREHARRPTRPGSTPPPSSCPTTSTTTSRPRVADRLDDAAQPEQPDLRLRRPRRGSAVARAARRGRATSASLPNWDNTPRKPQGSANLFLGSTPQKYESWLERAIDKASAQRHEFVLINAWNEWAEGAYLEPDLRHGRAYLEATARAVGVDPTRVDLTAVHRGAQAARVDGAPCTDADALQEMYEDLKVVERPRDLRPAAPDPGARGRASPRADRRSRHGSGGTTPSSRERARRPRAAARRAGVRTRSAGTR